ncbi:MAG TPA: hypothetical protein VFE56_10965 [Candidatus Binataceae bacterium]|nr:hypothetical protein [Candidatus Binataceae bacterium]
MSQRTDNQQPPFDAVLKRGLNGQRSPGGDDCPDAAALAAYCDRSLPLSQSARLDEHFSNCARCQGALAAMARAQTSQLTAAPRSFARRWELYAAIAAGVAGISIVASLMRTARHPITAAIMTRNELAAPAQVMQESEPKAKESGPLIALNEAAPRANPAAEAPVGDQPEREATKRFGAGVLAPRGLFAKAAKPGNMERHGPELSYLKSEGAFRAQPAPPGDAGSQRRLATAEPRLMDQGAPAAASPSPPPSVATRELGNAPSFGPAAPPVPAPATDLPAAGSGSTTCCAPVTAPGAGSLRGPPAARIAHKERKLEMVSIYTADNIERWRLGAQGLIQHRASDGQWLRQDSGVSTALTAGAAPSPSVCWVVGAGGTVVLSTDGEHWQRLNSPTSANLAAVSAIDASSAVVTTADGRRFSTSDGGRTWRPM